MNKKKQIQSSNVKEKQSCYNDVNDISNAKTSNKPRQEPTLHDYYVNYKHEGPRGSMREISGFFPNRHTELKKKLQEHLGK